MASIARAQGRWQQWTGGSLKRTWAKMVSLGLAPSSFVLAIDISVQLSKLCERISLAANLEDSMA